MYNTAESTFADKFFHISACGNATLCLSASLRVLSKCHINNINLEDKGGHRNTPSHVSRQQQKIDGVATHTILIIPLSNLPSNYK